MAYPITADVIAALQARDQQVQYRADVLVNGVVTLSGLPVSTGSVTVNSSQSPRRTCTLTVIDDGGNLAPGTAADLLAPYGNELALYRGLTVAGTPVLIPMGVFRIDKAVSATSGGSVQVTLTGSDRSARVTDDKYTDYAQVAVGTNAATAIMSIVSPALPAAQQYSFAPVTATVAGLTFAPGDDRWAQATTIATNAGCLLYFDATGTLVLTPVPDPSATPPAWTFNVGEASVLTTASNSLDRTPGANTIVVTASGSSVTTPLMSVAQDLNPASPTYVNGPFGTVVKALTTSTLTAQADLDAYAAAQLLLVKGATQQVPLTSIALPHLDAYDTIQVTVPKVKVAGKYVIDQLSIPLGPGTMSLTTRGIVV